MDDRSSDMGGDGVPGPSSIPVDYSEVARCSWMLDRCLATRMEGIAVTGSSKKMRPRDAASFIGIALSTLARMRARGHGPPFSKPSGRIVIYDQQQIERWLLGHIRCNQLQNMRGD